MAEAPKPLRVLMTADTLSGVLPYAVELAASLGKYRTHIDLCLMGPPPSETEQAALAKLQNLTVHHEEFALEWMPEPWAGVDGAGKWLIEVAKKTDPDVVHINGYVHAACPFEAPSVVIAHSCVCSWWRAVKGVDAPDSLNEYRERVTRGLSAADILVGPTRAIVEDVLDCYDLPHLPFRVIHNGRRGHADLIDPRRERLVLSVGRWWDEAKNIAVLDACAAQIEWPLFIIGPTDGPDGTRVATDSVRRLGDLEAPEIHSWLSRAPIFCLPARYEPFGLQVLEAAMSGCALVLGNIPSLRELWRDAAVFVDPSDADGLVREISALIREESRRNELSRRAHARARRFTSRKMGRAYHRLYEQLANSYALTGQQDESDDEIPN